MRIVWPQPVDIIMEFVGEKDFCFLCNEGEIKIEGHHLSYSPELVVFLCVKCHRTLHNLKRLSKDKIDLVLQWLTLYGMNWESGNDNYYKSEYGKSVARRSSYNWRDRHPEQYLSIKKECEKKWYQKNKNKDEFKEKRKDSIPPTS